MNTQTSNSWRHLFSWLVPLALVGYVLSGIYQVGGDEQGVVRLFGKVWQKRVSPGLHYRPPFPFTRLDRLKVRKVRRFSIGMEVGDSVVARQASPLQAQFLSGDQNIINIRAVVQYTINDPVKFLFAARDAARTARRVAESVLAEAVAQTPVDAVLTTGKIAVQNQVQQQTQRQMEKVYDLGISVMTVNIARVLPPEEVKAAFQMVTDARQAGRRAVLDAESYAGSIIPQTRGEAEKMKQDALAYQDSQIATSHGNTARFLAVDAEYQKAKEVTGARVYLEAMEEILPRIKKIVVDSQGGALGLGLIKQQP